MFHRLYDLMSRRNLSDRGYRPIYSSRNHNNIINPSNRPESNTSTDIESGNRYISSSVFTNLSNRVTNSNNNNSNIINTNNQGVTTSDILLRPIVPFNGRPAILESNYRPEDRSVFDYGAVLPMRISSSPTHPLLATRSESFSPLIRRDSNDVVSALQRYTVISFILLFLFLISALILGSFLLLLSLLGYMLLILPITTVNYPIQMVFLYWLFVSMFATYLGAFILFLIFAYQHIVYYFVYFTLEL